jgi:peptidoglycan/xylan/chitin deacetylase (PgdA/CDA1 family)
MRRVLTSLLVIATATAVSAADAPPLTTGATIPKAAPAGPSGPTPAAATPANPKAAAAPPPAAAPAVSCANPNALGVARTVEIDTTGGPGFGFDHYKVHDFLEPKEIVLTFDDGPQEQGGTTKAVLDALARHCTKATFFSIGYMALGMPQTIREVSKAGHSVGTHTWKHIDVRKFKTDKEAIEEIERGISAVRRAVSTTLPRRSSTSPRETSRSSRPTSTASTSCRRSRRHSSRPS